jgi:hypothetical protein
LTKLLEHQKLPKTELQLLKALNFLTDSKILVQIFLNKFPKRPMILLVMVQPLLLSLDDPFLEKDVNQSQPV